MPSSIRLRLTLWYVSVFGTVLVIFSAYVYSSASRNIRARFDASVLRTAEEMANYFDKFAERNNLKAGAKETVLRLREGRESEAIFRENELLASNDDDVASAVASTGVLKTVGRDGRSAFLTDRVANRRLVVFPFQLDTVDYEVAVFEPLDKLEAEIDQMREVILFGLPAALVLATVGGILLARKSLQPMVTISEQAEHINASNLCERLKMNNPDDELGRLAGVFNALLSRLENSFTVMREFMADASHELRTPLTIIHGEAEVSLGQDHTAGEYRRALRIIRDQTKRMACIVRDMLVLARADAGEHQLRTEEFYLNELVEDCCQAAQSLAAPKSIRLSWDAGEDLPYLGNEELLKRMVVNLVDNAIHYTPESGTVSVKLSCEQAKARLVVSDSGIGIPKECLGRIFDRFYRVNDSRMRSNGGSGLGLSIVKLAAESHGGSVEVTSEPDHGSTFAVSLPL